VSVDTDLVAEDDLSCGLGDVDEGEDGEVEADRDVAAWENEDEDPVVRRPGET
jgi:hypothetical protein